MAVEKKARTLTPVGRFAQRERGGEGGWGALLAEEEERSVSMVMIARLLGEDEKQQWLPLHSAESWEEREREGGGKLIR